MQSNENNINDDDDRSLPPAAAGGGAKQEQDESLAGDDEDDDDAPRSRSGFWSHRQPIIVPTKTYDGGMNENERQQLQQQERQRQRQANDSNHGIATLSTSTTTHDLFQTYSDTDTRMLSLLGLEPAANPNVDVGEQQEDWRQLTGFLGLGIRRDRGRRGGNQDAAESQAAAEGTEGTMPPRQTRISLELHVNAFTNMWTQRGELDLPNVLPDPPRGEPPQQRQHDTSSSSSSDQNGQDGDKAQGESH